MTESVREKCEAQGLLKTWLKLGRRSQAWLARTLGVSAPSVSAWLDGTSRPLPHHRAVIEALTGIETERWEFPSETRAREEALARIHGAAPGDAAE